MPSVEKSEQSDVLRAFSPLLTQAQEAHVPAKLPTAVRRSELNAAASVPHDRDDLDAETENAFKNELKRCRSTERADTDPDCRTDTLADSQRIADVD